MKSGENGLIGPGDNDYGRKKEEFKPLEHLGGHNKIINDLILQSNNIGKLLDSTLDRYEKSLQLLIECQKALNYIPRVKIYKVSTEYKDTYDLVSDISKFLEDGTKS